VKSYGLMTDLHFGIRKGSSVMLDWQLKAFNKSFQFFKNEKVTDIIILGDSFDHRITNTTLILDVFLNKVIIPLKEEFNNVYILVGNHDMFYTNTRNCNILSVLIGERFDNVHIIDNIVRKDDILFVPWVCSKEDIKRITYESKKGGVLIGHLEINGFKMTKNGKVCDFGLKRSLFKNFDLVLSGHFHLKNNIGNINYLGTMLALNWGEYNSPHGINILKNNKLTFHDLEISMFDYLIFENRVYELEELDKYENKIVKIIIDKEEINEELFENLLLKLSNICYKYIKEHVNSQVSENIEENDLEVDNDDIKLVENYLDSNLIPILNKDVFLNLYSRIKNKVLSETTIDK